MPSWMFPRFTPLSFASCHHRPSTCFMLHARSMLNLSNNFGSCDCLYPTPVASLRFFSLESRFGYHYSFICWKEVFFPTLLPFLFLLIFFNTPLPIYRSTHPVPLIKPDPLLYMYNLAFFPSYFSLFVQLLIYGVVGYSPQDFFFLFLSFCHLSKSTSRLLFF